MQTSPKLTPSTLPAPTNQTVALSSLRPHPRNYNRHPARQIERIAQSLATFGQPRSIVVWRSTILAGHGVVEAARSLGWTELRADVLADDYPEHLALAYVVADNELSRLADPDEAALAQLLDEARAEDAGLLAAMGYDEGEFQELLARVGGDVQGDGDAEPQIDRAEELRVKWCVESGQLWRIGEHRLICGDCTDAAVVARVMGGERAGAVVTDPPYGVKWNTDPKRSRGGPGYPKIIGDDVPFDPTPLLSHEIAVLWGANHYAARLPSSSGWLVWDKRPSGYVNDQADCELAWTNLPVPARVFRYAWSGGGTLAKENGVEYRSLHPTQKPVSLLAWCIEQTKVTPGALVFDPFLGSGTTLVACENLHRRGRGVEISPAYVAVALQRMADAFPGIEIELLP